MDLAVVLGFAVIALSLIAVPGPDWAYLFAVGGRQERVVLPAVGGLVLGYAMITLVTAAGLGAIATSMPTVLVAITLAGAGYLLYLGVKTLRGVGHAAAAPATGGIEVGARGYVGRGMAVSGLNPKGILVFLAILPQFTQLSAPWPMPVQLAVLGGVFMLVCGVFYSLLGLSAQKILGARPDFARLTTRIAGVAMIVLGLGMLAERAVQGLHG